MFDFNVNAYTKKAQSFIRKVCRNEKSKDILIGISGGIDSATSLTLTVKALGKQHVYPILMPYGKLHPESERDARLVIDSLKIPKSQIMKVDIKPFVDSVIAYDNKMDEGRRGNIMARMRMVVLHDLSKKLNMMVVGTENKSEHLLGYYTRFGDEASDIEPLRQLYKTQVFELAKYLNVPKQILTKDPTAGLWEGQTDEKEFGFPYKIADEILYLYYDKKLSRQQIIKKGYDKLTVERVWWWIEKGELKDRLPYIL